MAFIGIQVPHSTARLFGDIEAPGAKTPSASMHVTILYIGEDIPIEVLASAVKAAFSVTSQTRPFTVRTTRVMSFPANDDQEGHPVIACIESDSLHELHDALAEAFEEAGVDFSKKYPVYKPHVTLAYAPEAVDEFRIPTIEWGAHEVVLWGGDEGDRKLVVTFPLALTPPASATVTAALAGRVTERFRSEAVARRYSLPSMRS